MSARRTVPPASMPARNAADVSVFLHDAKRNLQHGSTTCAGFRGYQINETTARIVMMINVPQQHN